MKKLIYIFLLCLIYSCTEDCNNVCTDTVHRKIYDKGELVEDFKFQKPVRDDCYDRSFPDTWRDKQGRKVIDHHNIRCDY